MQIGLKIKQLREKKSLSQGDVEHKTGLLRCYTSRVEHGYTVPTIETLEKYARAFEVPLYQFFTDEDSVKRPEFLPASKGDSLWGNDGDERRELRRFIKTLARLDGQGKELLFKVARQMASKKKPA